MRSSHHPHHHHYQYDQGGSGYYDHHQGVGQSLMFSSFASGATTYPLRGIPHPHAHDVLCGRGGQSNTHPGNLQWRTLVAANKELYVSLPKKQKMLLSQSIVNAVRSQNPPGRFLQKDASSEHWFDVGDKRAQEKTSQALREGAPEIRSKLKGSKNTKKKKKKDDDDEEAEDKDDEANETQEEDTKPPEITSIERNTSREQMPPPPIATVISTSTISTIHEPEPHSEPKAPTTVPSHDQKLPVPQRSKADDEEIAPPPNMEGEFSFGSIALMSEAEQARLMNAAPMSMMPHPVDNGLDQTGFSFGSMMSIGTNTGQKLERGGLSIGSMMSYTVTDNSKSVQYHHHHHKRVDSFGAAPDFTDIGTSFGSLSINPIEREGMIREARKEMDAAEVPPTFLKVQKSTGNLLECSDSDEETEPEIVAQKSANWERLQAAIAAQDMHKQQQPEPGGLMPIPLPPGMYRNDEPPMISVPATEGVCRNFSNMSAISVTEDFEPHPFLGFQAPQQQQPPPLQFGVGYYGSSNNTTNNHHLSYHTHQHLPEMPLPLPIKKKDDSWGDLHHRYEHGYGR